MPCLGPTGDPDLRYPMTVREFRCDLRDEDPQRLLEAFTLSAVVVFGPSTTAVDLTFPPDLCDCQTPRFDAVTLAGVRHSEFCCACGRPGTNDHTC
jgi:hypothetical protein